MPTSAFLKPAAKKPGIGESLGKDYDRMTPDWNKNRRAGVIVHPTSLPGPYGIGEIGIEARKLVDWLQEGGMQCWQVLPLVPPDPKYYSPYSGLDSNCGNPLLISIDDLIALGLLAPSDAPPTVPIADVDFEAVAATKFPLLKKAAQALLSDASNAALKAEMDAFRKLNAWVEDSALFDVLRQQPDVEELLWWDWPEPLRFRQEAAMKEARALHAAAIDEFIAIQFLFDLQWKALKVRRAPAYPVSLPTRSPAPLPEPPALPLPPCPDLHCAHVHARPNLSSCP
jgi:4-alpha-glucanotransferase